MMISPVMDALLVLTFSHSFHHHRTPLAFKTINVCTSFRLFLFVLAYSFVCVCVSSSCLFLFTFCYPTNPSCLLVSIAKSSSNNINVLFSFFEWGNGALRDVLRECDSFIWACAIECNTQPPCILVQLEEKRTAEIEV